MRPGFRCTWSGIRRDLGSYYSAIGGPSIDPEFMIRVLLVGYIMASGRSDGCARRST